MDTYTKEQWLCSPTAGHDTHGQSAIYSEADGKTVAMVYDGDKHGALLAAAPDLAEALRALTDRVDMVCRGVAEQTELLGLAEAARAALGKAGVE